MADTYEIKDSGNEQVDGTYTVSKNLWSLKEVTTLTIEGVVYTLRDASKVSLPLAEGTDGQVLAKKGDGTEWITVTLTETDPTVPAWAKEATKPSYTYSEIRNTPDLSVYATKEYVDGEIELVLGNLDTAPISHVSVEASTNVLGHVKVDGQTIQIDSNGVIKAIGGRGIGGRGIGEIFAYPSALPPNGAYLLNGQTITGCETLYPDFWNWLTSQIGEYETVPIYKAWTQTPLTADGTIGGSDYAVEASGTIASGFNAWESFNMTPGKSETVCVLNNTQSGSITFYSPVPLRINSVTFTRATNVNANNIVVEYIISGSNDNSTWTELASGDFTDLSASATLNIPIDSSKYSTNYSYKYYKFYGVNNGGTANSFPKIYLFGEEFVRAKQESNGYIRAINAEGYEAEIAEYGMCGAFVISGSDVRLPKWNGYQTPLGNSVPVIGNGMTLGLTNGTTNVGLGHFPSIAFAGDDLYYGSPVGSSGGNYVGGNTSYGVTQDSTKSGIIADTSGLYPDRWSWVIQVFNTATDLSNQESAQLASQMQMKAQKDLGNVEKVPQITVDNIMPDTMDYVVESWNDGQGNWYRLYRSGWVEQGGVTPKIASNATLTVTLYIEMRDVEFSTIVTNGAKASVDDNWDYGAIGGYATSTTTILVDRARGAGKAYWRVAGMAAN